MRFRQIFAIFVLAGALVQTGCHSAHIDTTISNRTAAVLTLIEVDYPSASFGVQTLAPGADFHYRFKVLGSGAATVQWTDAGNREHKSTGPTLQESDEGSLSIQFNPGGDVIWTEQFGSP
jgi:hypothetical protein